MPDRWSDFAERPAVVNTVEKLAFGARVLGAVALNQRVPLLVGWNITHRCNLKCAYCGLREVSTPEIDTVVALKLVDEFAGLGTRYVSLLGGEPLLREDLHEIARRCVDRGLHMSIDTNGILVPQRLATLRLASRVQVSLDGPPAINDAVRGRGVHDHAVRAIELCRNEGIPVEINTVISRGGEASAFYILDLADRFGIGAYFQPADPTLSGSSDRENPSAPDPNSFRSTIAFLIDEKRKGRRSVLNTAAGLDHLEHWPEPRKVACRLGRFFCVIEPDGGLSPCDNVHGFRSRLVSTTNGFESAFRRLRPPSSCRHCWCASKVDVNLIIGPNPLRWWNAWMRLRAT